MFLLKHFACPAAGIIKTELSRPRCAWYSLFFWLGKVTIMMGKKERHFAPLINVSVEELVPHDHFYRYLERTLDLSFVREAGARELCRERSDFD